MVARSGGFSWAYYSAPIGEFLQDGDGCLAALARYGAAAGSVEGPQIEHSSGGSGSSLLMQKADVLFQE